MRVFIFNVLKALLELFLHAYFPWLDPLHYLDLSRSMLVADRGYINIRRRIGPVKLPIVWHQGIFTNLRACFLATLSVLVFILNQAAFDVDTDFFVEPASVGRVKSGKVIFGSNSFRCRDALDEDILKNSNYCYDGDWVGNPCSGNHVNKRTCGLNHDRNITLSGIEKEGTAILCSAQLNSTATLFWVGNGTKQGVLITGVEGEFRPITLEIIRRTTNDEWAEYISPDRNHARFGC